MKRSLLVLATLGMFADVTQAQSSVMLYGMVDANIEYISHTQTITTVGAVIPGSSGSRLAIQADDLPSNRRDLRGVEGIGGSFKSLFILESGFTMDTDALQQDERLFGRQTFAGLQGNWGKVTPGWQYTVIFDMMVDFSPTGYATQYESVVGQLDPNFYEDDMVKYTSAFDPVTVEGHWTSGEHVDSQTTNSAYDVGANYFGGPFGLGTVYDEVKVLTIAEALGGPSNRHTKDKRVATAASYTMGSVKLMGGYRHGKTDTASSGATLALLPHRDDCYWAGASYQMTFALGLTLTYYYDKIKGATISGATVSPRNPQQWQFITDYNFSKHTDVYLSATYARNASLNWDPIGYVTNPATGAQTSMGYLPVASQTYFVTPNSDNQASAATSLRRKF